MNSITPEDAKLINEALNEATVLAVAYDNEKNSFFMAITPIAVDKEDHPLSDRLILRFDTVSRLAASCRQGRWDDDKAAVIPLKPEGMQENVKKFGTFEIYGLDFIDSTENNFEKSENRLSFDYRPTSEVPKHTFEFARDTDEYLACKVWFDSLSVYRTDKNEINLQDFINNGKRAWEAINNHNTEIQDWFGIYPLRSGK